MKTIVETGLADAMLDPSAATEPSLQISRASARSVSQAPDAYFTGNVHVEMLFVPVGPDRASAGSVTFSPGACTAWHSHPLGQTLIVTAGVGHVQRWNGPVEEIHPGDVVRIPPNVKHWHGAAPESSMTHIAIQEELDGKAADWMEKVTSEEYSAAPAGRPDRPNR